MSKYLGVGLLALTMAGCQPSQPTASSGRATVPTPPVPAAIVPPPPPGFQPNTAAEANNLGLEVSSSQLTDGTAVRVITSPASANATPEQRQAAVASVLASVAGAATETGVSAESIKAEMLRDFLAKHPKARLDQIGPIMDEMHRQVVVLSRRRDGSVSADYYRKQMAMRLDTLVNTYPQLQ